MGLSPLYVKGAENSVPVVIQLSSVRDAAESDLAWTLRQLATIGYYGVELSGTYGHSADELKQMLDDVRLVCVGSHLTIGELLGERFDAAVLFNRRIGNPNLVVAGGLKNPLAHRGGNSFTAHFFSHLAEKAKNQGLRIGLCSCSGNFVDLGDGHSAWSCFFRQTDPSVIAELDVGKCLADGGDPYAEIQNLAGRGELIHISPSKPDGTMLGEEGDETDWQRVFYLCENVENVKYYVVEQECNNLGLSSIEAAARCFETMKKWGKC
jgi:sugar phosphate isomerase/epimerase